MEPSPGSPCIGRSFSGEIDNGRKRGATSELELKAAHMRLLHDLALTASDLERSVSFYDGLMGHFGYGRIMTTEMLAAWDGRDFEFLLYQATLELRSRQQELYQPVFHHLASGRAD